MRSLFLAIVGTAAMTAPLRAADFVPPSQLPSVPEMPDPFTTLSGKKITTKEEWETLRKPELKQLFQHYMYGEYPAVKPTVSGKVLFEDKEAFGGKATLREVAVTMAANTSPVHVLIAVPNKRTASAAAFVGLNFTGNHSITKHPKVRIPTAWMRAAKGTVVNNKATEEGRGTSDSFPLEMIVERGYAVATAYYGEIIPDDPNVREGLRDTLMPLAAGKQAPWATGAVMAWAWGLQRMADYLVTQPEIDAKRLAVIGHSRLGKTALLAAALDDRFVVAYPSQGGCGGPGPSRSKNPKAETVKRITTAFPHWFAPNFAQFGDDTTKLPFDQHLLVALCAPRAVLFTNATDDEWANPSGQFDVLRAATPVYKLLGADGLTAEKYPSENQLLDSRLGYWVRPGKHAMGPDDWKTYLAFADKWLK